MPPILYLLYAALLLFKLFSASCLADTLQSPSNSQALVHRSPDPPHDDPPLSQDLELLDIVLVASVDGKFHALNRTSGHTLWSMSSFAPTTASVSAPPTLGPLIRTTHVDLDPETTTDDAAHQEMYIIEPQSGDIYIMATPSSPLQRFPFSMPELVDMSPFTYLGDEERRVFVGRKETSLLLIELETGKVKATLNSECPWDPFEDLKNDEMDLDLDQLEEGPLKPSAPTEVFIGRTDYHISIYSRPTNRIPGTPLPPVQNLSFSTYGPNNQDNHLQASYRTTQDEGYIQSLPNGEIIYFKAKSTSTGGRAVWGRNFNTPIVAIFDVLQKPSHPHKPHPFVLLQPRPRLQDVIPNLSHTARLPNLDSAYVGMVEETGSLFAMSPDHYPLVVFGGPERYNQGRLLDAPGRQLEDRDDDDDEGEEGRSPTAVDEITRLRKQRQRMDERKREACVGDSYSRLRDRRCLVGVRRLEDGDGHESRMRRLLDGPVRGEVGPEVLSNGSTPVDEEEVLEDPGLGMVTGAKEARKFWEVVIVSVVVGILSVWFVVRRIKRKSLMVLVEEEERKRAEEDVMTPTPSTAGIPTTPLTAGPVDVQEPVQSPITNGFKDSPKSKDSAQSLLPIADDGDESGGDGEDPVATPGKRKGRRGKRGKKKKAGAIAGSGGGGAEEVEEEKKLNGAAHVNGLAVVKEVETPSPPQTSLVITSSPKPAPTGPSLIVSDTILGFGSHGTVVFQGSLQGRAVAVKRLLQDFVTLASREVSILQESDDHPNVIRYYYQEAHANFLYIALELCPASLADIIESPDRDQFRDIAISFDPKKALKQIAGGLKHLHALKLVHRDIKPQNILVSTSKAGGTGNNNYRMLISDFGLCKKLDVDQTSFYPTANGAMGAGTVGWRAPEILRGDVKLDEVTDEHSLSSRGSTSTIGGSASSGAGGAPTTGKRTRLTKSVDIFALGCLFYYTLTNGGHPYGDRFEREVNIMKNAKNLDGLATFGEEGTEASDLITQMLDPEASERPDTTTCLLHPFFWDSSRRLNFLQDASDRFEIMCRDPKDPNLLNLEKDAITIVGPDWHARLDRAFTENLGKFRKYDGKSVQDLLRALRNKKHHYQDLPENVKRSLGPMPEGFLAYFTRRYPRLFLHVHAVIKNTGLCSEPMFRAYFELPES
ncbi:hypothetical protein K443DRAFT_106542 [Laccaria amethystina LaAM-08-1]|uniref:non-specific serine/threonine protein kinase n=1 Tax=Laccaria amethystina LaAM-08-1 TaxID=1095629 RepID=A0A0C9XGR5_9AGAR|nr:hypothetical protein K443DRAFT_106542 [Laccaria amethystina LaAM-08-1]